MSTSPAVLHLNGEDEQAAPIRRGDTYSHAFTFVNGAGTAINKSAVTILAQVRDRPGDGAVVAEFTSAVSGASSNVVTISLTALQTAQLAPGTHYGWDYQETESGVVTTRLAGEVTVTQDYSR